MSDKVLQFGAEDIESGWRAGWLWGVTWARDEAGVADLRYLCDSGPCSTDELFDMLEDYCDGHGRAEIASMAEALDHHLPSFTAGFHEGFLAGARSVWRPAAEPQAQAE